MASETTKPETKTITLPHGIAGAGLATVQRQVPADEPPALPVNGELSAIGKPVPRLDARLKVTGAARYTADVALPGLLHARLLDAPHAHARIRRIDTAAAERHPEVRAVHVLDTITGGATLRDQPAAGRLAGETVPPVRYAGQPLAAVAATSRAAAEEAVRLIRVQYEPLPFAADLDAAMAAGAPLVFDGPVEQEGSGGGGGAPRGLPQRGNVRGPDPGARAGGPRGDVARGLTEADIVVEGQFNTQVQTHSALEPHGIVADWRADGLTVWLSTQDTAGARQELAQRFGLPLSRVRVITEFMGGGFGAKFGIGNYGAAAVHLSRATGAPVKLMLDRREEHTQVGNRPSARQTVRVGARRDGTLTAISVVSHGTAGTGLGAGVGTVAQAMYRCANVALEQYDLLTNAGPGAAFRAPGNPQGAFSLEQLIDELAERLGMDPLALRDRIDESPQRREQRRLGAERVGWATRRRPPGSDGGPIKRGIGVAQSFWPRLIETGAAAEVRVYRDGSVEVRSSVQDIGTGIRTVLAQVVAEELGLAPGEVTVRIGDTMFPAGNGSGGSRTTASVTPAARNAAWKAKAELLRQAAPALRATPDQLTVRGGRVVVASAPERSLSFREAAAVLATDHVAGLGVRGEDYGGQLGRVGRLGISHGGLGGVQFVEVAVDVETGIVKVERVVAVHDCGRPMNPLHLESQINGGILQGLSWALYENRLLDPGSGRMVNADLQTYKIAGARETPAIEIALLEDYQGRSSTDAFGIGEPAIIPTAAAVANAVYNATGARMRDLPMTPAVVLAGLGRIRPADPRRT
jgi:xanthine dehydrogenase YagR molybdenum-binding subunit